MSDVKALAQERTQLFTDVLDGKIPKRVPIFSFMQQEFAMQYAGKNLAEAQWDSNAFEEVTEIICRDFITDNVPVHAVRYPSIYQQLGARNWVMGSNGFIQHPEIEGLAVEDYDYFIEAPLDCFIERVLPRLYSELDNKDPMSIAFTLAKAFKTFSDEFGNQAMQTARIREKYGYAEVNFMAAICEAPFDYLADQMRGFKGISLDIRRIPDKVEAAVEALVPWVTKMGMQPFPSLNSATFIPLHMAPYMRDKDFARFYWPGFKKQLDGLAAAGFRSFIYCENNWMRYLDYLAELPAGTIMFFEDGDPKLVKEKLGRKHIITGFYPLTLLKTGTKQECIDKAKELIDILAPGGGYIFSFDKVLITQDGLNVDNLKAVWEYVASNSNY
ncbi:hypothetical protein Tfer_2620 [Thermincola ferriacetica]|uniref:Uroporphyrinogen decarboxylase (URO-D) domain-containing protein n=1 Tax=Thermincola ferriacetica TaxID=281456 RepID=A0A0L6VZZ8_9FIRM|nr:uroporphyrinogen decarboxylase family protein [Thermincola ferriacetica]KNZ68850.1 hypothetical protein Tfer_2620 [Thermincola ferriacetica]